jgi:hypothetical protein
VRARRRLLDLDLLHAPVGVGDHGVEHLGVLDGEEEERQPVVGEPAVAVGREPDRVGRPTSTWSSGGIMGSARKSASQSPAGCGCTVNDTCAEQALPP